MLPTLFSQMITFGLQSVNIYAIGRKIVSEQQALYANLVLLGAIFPFNGRDFVIGGALFRAILF